MSPPADYGSVPNSGGSRKTPLRYREPGSEADGLSDLTWQVCQVSEDAGV